MVRTADPTFSVRPNSPWMTYPQPSLICCATNGPDDPENGVDGPRSQPDPEPEKANTSALTLFTDLSPNIRPIPAAETISAPKRIYCSEENDTIGYPGTDYSIDQLIQFSINPQTGRRRAVLVKTSALPYEISLPLFYTGQLEYVRRYIDDIVFCPFILITDPDNRNRVYIPDAGVYIETAVGRERKLFVSLNKHVDTDPNGDVVFDPCEGEVFINIIEGAVRLHIMTNVMLGKAPEEHLELSFIRKQAIPIQISAIDVLMQVYEKKHDTDNPIYAQLMNFKHELTEELMQLQQ